MAYITQYTYTKLCQNIDLDFDTSIESFINHISDDKELYFILNKFDIEFLFKYKLVLEDEEKFSLKYFKTVPEEIDTKQWVFNKGGTTKYHSSKICPMLTRDYLDFHIPDDISKKGDAAIDDYRTWFIQNNFAEKYKANRKYKETIRLQFNAKYCERYGIEPIQEGSNILIVEKKNSQNLEVVKSFNYTFFMDRISHLKQQFHHHFSCKNTRTLSKFRFLIKKDEAEINRVLSTIFSENFTKNYGIKNIKEKFQTSTEIISEIINLLKEYLMWKYNFPEKVFDEIVLETFGLERCKKCSKPYSNDNIEINYFL